eukprot:1156504-Pelagomonas_calceolata.AAC.13
MAGSADVFLQMQVQQCNVCAGSTHVTRIKLDSELCGCMTENASESGIFWVDAYTNVHTQSVAQHSLQQA